MEGSCCSRTSLWTVFSFPPPKIVYPGFEIAIKYKTVVNDTKALRFVKQKLAMHRSASREEHHSPLLSDELPEGSTEHSETGSR